MQTPVNAYQVDKSVQQCKKPISFKPADFIAQLSTKYISISTKQQA